MAARSSLTRGCGFAETPLCMKLAQPRPNVFTLKATHHELATLVAAARMAHELMREDPKAPREIVETLDRILKEYDEALRRLSPDRA